MTRKKKLNLVAAAGPANAADAFVQGASDAAPVKKKTVRLNVDVDPDLHLRLKRTALDRGVKVSELVRELIERELSE